MNDLHYFYLFILQQVEFDKLEMPFKCLVYNCRSNYRQAKSYCTVYRLPALAEERQQWVEAIPYVDLSGANSSNFRICEKHWESNTPMVKCYGRNRPARPPTIFDVPSSSMPTPKFPLRKAKKDFASQTHFDKKDKFGSYNNFSPMKELNKKYDNIMYKECSDRFIYAFMTPNYTDVRFIISVINKPTLVCPATVTACKVGCVVPVPQGI